MLKLMKTHRKIIGNIMIALLFVSGCSFLLAGNWDAGETKDVCGYCGAEVTTTSVCSCCDGANSLTDSDKNGASVIPKKHSESNNCQ